MRELLAVIFALAMVSSETGFGETVRSLSKGDNKMIIAELVQKMRSAAENEIISMPEILNQYLLATPLVITTQKNKQSFDIDNSNVKFYINTNYDGRNEDCDAECLKEIGNIQTKLKPDALPDKCGKKTEFHTELLFLYGKHFYKELRNGPKIFLVFSHYVPCSGLSKCSFGECAGDMAYHRHQYNNKGIYFIVIYEKYFAPGGQGTGSNADLSELYLRLAGIPLWHCLFRENAGPSCAPSNSNSGLPLKHILNPVFQRFPRLYDNSRKKTEIFSDCLARGGFVQCITRVNHPLPLEADEILDEFVREYFLAQFSLIRNYRDFVMAAMRLKGCPAISHCISFMAKIKKNRPDRKLALNELLKKKLAKNPGNNPTLRKIREIRDDACTHFGARLTLKPPKEKPDICPRKPKSLG